MAQGTNINGRNYSYSSLELSIIRPGGSSEIFVNVDSISYSDALEIAMVNGTNQGPIGWTAGTYSAADATLSMGKSDFQKGIVEKIGHGWMGANLIVSAKYSDVGEPLTVDKLIARISGASDTGSYGAESLRTALTLKVFMIERNGIRPIVTR